VASTVQCSHCNKTTIKTENTQDISLHIEADSSTLLAEKLQNFFQSETLEGDNAYWCDTCHKSCQATKILSYTHIPTILIVHLKRFILGKKTQTHMPFDTVLEMKPYLAPGQASPQKMELIGIISHQGTKDPGHYVAITKRGNEWISYNDAITAQTTSTQLHQTQAYIMIHRKMDHNEATGINAPRDSTMADQQLPAKKSKPLHKTQHSYKESPLHPDPPIKFPQNNLPRQDASDGGVIPQPNPKYEEGPRRTWRYSKPSLVIALPHRPKKPGGRARNQGGGRSGRGTRARWSKCSILQEGRPQADTTR